MAEAIKDGELQMKFLSTKILLSALGLALLASSAFAQRARTPHFSEQYQTQMQNAPEAHGGW